MSIKQVIDSLKNDQAFIIAIGKADAVTLMAILRAYGFNHTYSHADLLLNHFGV